MSRFSLRYEQGEFEAKVAQFLQTLGIPPAHTSVYMTAFIHRSVLNEAPKKYTQSNERLEFLGDAVLELVITEKLFCDFLEKTEGELTDIRSALVRGRNLANIAAQIGISEVIQLSRGEYQAGGHENPYLLANTFEALVGAHYLHVGFAAARTFVLEKVYSSLDEILHKGLYVDPKSHLQEYTQEIWGVVPTYAVIEEQGADHNKKYIVEVSLGNCVLGRGKGSSKKKSEQDAAENAVSIRDDWSKKIHLCKKKCL